MRGKLLRVTVQCHRFFASLIYVAKLLSDQHLNALRAMRIVNIYIPPRVTTILARIEHYVRRKLNPEDYARTRVVDTRPSVIENAAAEIRTRSVLLFLEQRSILRG